MRFLFIHQNFPGQFRYIAKALAEEPDNQVIGIGDTANLKSRPALHPKVRELGYTVHGTGNKNTHHYLRDYEGHVRRGQSVVRLLLKLRDEEGFQPDVVMVHPGWGEGLFIKDVFPKAKLVMYCEYYYQMEDSDVGFDPEFPSTFDDQLRIRIKNSTQLQSLVACDLAISPTEWQKSRYPAEFQHKIQVIHEGIDTDIVKPDPNAWVEIRGQKFKAGEEIVTYAARNLEPYRGFHTFMRCLPKLQELRPNARVIIVGGDDVSYGKRLPPGQTYRQKYAAEVKDKVDWSKVFFVGKLPYADYLKVLQVSAAHVYLTYPFVLSWSILEAMAAGCLVITSNTAPTHELIKNGSNGILTNFFNTEEITMNINSAIKTNAANNEMRKQAICEITNNYSLKKTINKLNDILTGRQKSPRAEYREKIDASERSTRAF